jgi:hypothetical protein
MMKKVVFFSLLAISLGSVTLQAASATSRKFAGTLRADSPKKLNTAGKSGRTLKQEENEARAKLDRVTISFAEKSTCAFTQYKTRVFKSTDTVIDVRRWIAGLTGVTNITLEAWTTNEKGPVADKKRIQPINMQGTVGQILCCDGNEHIRSIVYSRESSKVSAAQQAATVKEVTDRLAKGKGAATHGTSTQSSPPSTARRKSDAAGRVAAANKAAKKSGKAAPASAAVAAASA